MISMSLTLVSKSEMGILLMLNMTTKQNFLFLVTRWRLGVTPRLERHQAVSSIFNKFNLKFGGSEKVYEVDAYTVNYAKKILFACLTWCVLKVSIDLIFVESYGKKNNNKKLRRLLSYFGTYDTAKAIPVKNRTKKVKEVHLKRV